MGAFLDGIANLTAKFGASGGEKAATKAKTHEIEMSLSELKGWLDDNGLSVEKEILGRGHVISTAHVTGVDREDGNFSLSDSIGKNEAGEEKYRIHSSLEDPQQAALEIFEKISYNRAEEAPVQIVSRNGEVQQIPRDSDLEVTKDAMGVVPIDVRFTGVDEPIQIKAPVPELQANEFY